MLLPGGKAQIRSGKVFFDLLLIVLYKISLTHKNGDPSPWPSVVGGSTSIKDLRFDQIFFDIIKIV